MKITQFDDLYSNRLSAGDTLIGGSNGSNSFGTGGDVLGSPGLLSVVGLRNTVSLASNMGDNTVGTVLTTVQSSPWVAQFASPSNTSSAGSNTMTRTTGGQSKVTTIASSGAAQTLMIGGANVFDITLTANCTLAFTGQAASGNESFIHTILRQDATGNRTVTWPGSVSWSGGSAPTLSTTASAVDHQGLFTIDGGTNWFGFALGGAGGSTSFGSNAMSVGATNTGGVATDASRSDHRHLGLHSITSSSSNTLQRPTVNFRSGANVALSASDTDGDGTFDTITISATPTGGGSSIGNVSSGTALTMDYGKAQLLTVRANVNTEDDDFDAGTGSLAGKWLAYTSYDLSYSLSDIPGWLRGTSGGVKLQAVPAGDWTIETEVILGDIGAPAFSAVGLILTNGTNSASSTDIRWHMGNANTATTYRWVVEKFVNNVFSSTLSQQTFTGIGPTTHCFLQINKSSTTYTFLFSTVGSLVGGTAAGWQRYFQTSSLGITPTHFGIQTDQTAALWNYFRRF